jgi:ribosomal protein S16
MAALGLFNPNSRRGRDGNMNKKLRLRIRFKRRGAKHYPVYNIIVCKVLGRRMHEKIGFYNPHERGQIFMLKVALLTYWVKRGALVSTSVLMRLVKGLYPRSK